MRRRQTIPEDVAVALMVANRHTCCICHGRRKHVIIHHTDHGPANNSPDNLAVLCNDCHSRVEGDEGLGRRFTTAEVREYKRKWEAACAEWVPTGDGEESEQEIPILYEATLLGPTEHIPYDLPLEKGQELEVTVSAEEYIDVSICSESQYERWLRGEELIEYKGAERVREVTLNFEAPRSRTYLLLVINHASSGVDVEVEAVTWE